MPVVTIQMWEGRSVEQKRELVKAITKAMVDIAGATAEKLYIIMHDVPKTNWGMNGALSSDLPSKH
jgi:4-oxalocrotonate tautomerase